MIGLLSAQREARRAAERADRQRRRLHHSSHRLMSATKKRLTSPGSLALSFSAGVVTGVVFGGRRKRRTPAPGKSGKNIQKVKKTLSLAGRMVAGRALSLFASEVAGTMHRPAATETAADTGAAVPEA